MSKRRGENRQLRPEEVEAQEAEESVEAGVFQRASEEQLQKRKIVSVKRKKRPAAATAAPAPASLGGSASVGASFAGALHTGNGADSSPAASLLNPFQGFSALTPSAPSSAAKAGAASTSTSAPFSFGALGGGGGGGGAKEKAAGGAATGAGGVVVAGGGGFSFGARPSLPVPAKPSPSPAAPPGSSGSGSGSVSFSADTLGGGSGSFSAKPRPPSTPGPKSGGGGGGRGTEGDTAMTRLNSTFRRWVTAQASSKPLSSWAEGLRDYATHAERLRAKHSGSGGGSRAGEGAKEARAAIPALGSGTGPSEYPVTPGLSFGSSLAVPTPASGGGGSGGGGGNAKNTPSSVGFSFNAPANFFSAPAAPRAAAAAGGGGGFSFGGQAAAPTLPPAAAPAAAAAAAAEAGGGGGGGGDAEDGFPKEQPTELGRAAGEEDERVVREMRSKLFRFNVETKEWGDMGKGQLRLMRHKHTDKRRMVLRNEGGKVTLNMAVSSGMKFDKTSKGVQFVGPSEDGTALVKYLVQLRKAEIDSLFDSFVGLVPTS